MEAKIITIIKSRMDLVYRVAASPVRPSWMEPTMAIAPIHTVREAVTKPWMNWLSPPRSALAFSQAPSCSMRRSRSMNSPASAPRASARIMARVLPVPAEERTPFSAVSIPASAPEAPMNRVASPRAFKIPSW